MKFANSHHNRLFAAIAAISIMVIALVVILLFWQGNEVDRISRDRDKALFSLVLEQSVRRVGHAQESSTVWDDAVTNLAQRPVDPEWIDVNIGIWFNEYAGHDEVYILDPRNKPLYAMRNGKRADAATYSEVRSVIQPYVDRLRGDSVPESDPGPDIAMMSPGEAGLATLHGHPAIVSAKPVVTDTGDIVQKPGTEAVHISVVYLDGGFIARLSQRYGLAEGRFSQTANVGTGEAAIRLVNRQQRTVGFFVWRPFAPGGNVTAYVAPAILFVLACAGLIVFMLTRRLGLKTRDLEMSRAQAQHLALHDVLTGLPNRAMFENQLEIALNQSRRNGSMLAVLYIDLDRFKQVNDSLGHPAGDELIREVSARLIDDVRNYDTVARIGGDEFAILLVNPDSAASVKEIASRIVIDLNRPFDLLGSQAFIGGSVGVAISPDHGTDRSELIRKADIALYQAKAGGRSRYVVFDSSMDEAVRQREEIDRDLRQALADCDRQLKVHYQPVFSASTGEISAVEALLRWEHPESGLTSPAAFIPFAEESGLIEKLGEWVLKTAMRDASRWPELRLSVNVSPIQIRNPAFSTTIMKMLKSAGMKPNQLELEITETALLDNSGSIADALADLRKKGVRIALDDFGTGYSSLSHIRDIAVDRIKIDRSFVTAIEEGNGRALITAIAGLAQANGLQLTAEGVETPEQHDFLVQAGCNELQGYLLSHAIPADEIEARYRTIETEKPARRPHAA